MEEQGDAVQGTVTISCLDGEPMVFKADPVQGLTNAAKKEAANNAAELALTAFKDDIDAAIPVYEAKKAAAAAERGEKKFAEREAKKAQEEAAAEAAGKPAAKKAKKALEP